jgi:hypothetical protein
VTSESITGLILTIIFLAYLILETITSFRKHTPINPIVFILMAIGVFIGILLIYRGKELSAADLAQTILTIGLLTITAVYAWSTERIAKSTREQAKASLKMAKEMENQRYDTVRPFIDFELMSVEITHGIVNGLIEEDPRKTGVHAKIRNIGIGPAIDIYSFTFRANGERIKHDFGVLKVEGESKYVLFNLDKRNEEWFITAYYRDLYGRCFVSSREVIIRIKNNKYELGPLQSSPIKEEESND